MKGAAVRKIRQRLKLTQARFAKFVGVHRVTVARWEADKTKVPEPTARFIRVLAKGGDR